MSSKLNSSKTTNRIDPQVKIAALVFAGGRGERMGRVDKAMINAGGRMLIEIVCEKLRKECDQVYISRQADQTDLSAFGTIVIDKDIDQGPLAGVVTACRQAQQDGFDYLLTAPVDTGNLPAQIGAQLYKQRNPHAMAKSGDNLHPTLSLISLADTVYLFTQYNAGERSLRSWVQENSCGFLRIDQAELDNMNEMVKPL